MRELCTAIRRTKDDGLRRELDGRDFPGPYPRPLRSVSQLLLCPLLRRGHRSPPSRHHACAVCVPRTICTSMQVGGLVKVSWKEHGCGGGAALWPGGGPAEELLAGGIDLGVVRPSMTGADLVARPLFRRPTRSREDGRR